MVGNHVFHQQGIASSQGLFWTLQVGKFESDYLQIKTVRNNHNVYPP